ncbi:MAG: M42 family metallopeptidase [Anaerolineae bacterium]
MTELRDLLERLSNEVGPAGHEKAVRALIKAEVADLVDRVEVDGLGNLITFKVGTGPEPRLQVMLAAHMDEVGFMITEVGKGGTLSFRPVGGLDPRLLLAKRVIIGDERVPGVIGAPVPHLQRGNSANKVLDIDDLAIDIGAADQKAAEGKVKVGDYGTFATRFTVLSDDPAWPTVRGKAFDDRAGCAALIALLAERYPVDVYGVFTVQEEVGLRGARVAAYRVAPDAAIALEGTICDDLPQPPDEDSTPVTRLGDGPAITLMDRSMVSHPGLLRLLRETAEAEGIRVQYKAPGLGGTDSGAIHLTRAGVPAITVAVPCRYIHGPAAILNLNDLANTVKLVAAALRRIAPAHLARA